jgi:hypothetical protein
LAKLNFTPDITREIRVGASDIAMQNEWERALEIVALLLEFPASAGGGGE